MKKEIQIKKSLLYIDEPTGIMIQRVEKGAYLDIEDSREWIEAVYELFGGEPVYFLSDMRDLKGQSKDSRRISGDKDPRLNIYGAAGLISNGTSKMLGNFILSLNNLSHPVKLFTSEQKALDWLIELKKKNGH